MSRSSTSRPLPRTVPGRMAVRIASAGGEAGMTTAEYAVGTVAACGFAGILYKIITSAEILGLLREVIASAFRLSF